MSGNPPAGYYADPSIPGYIRYWDGHTWVAGTSRPAPDEPGAGGREPAARVQDAVGDPRASDSGAAAAAAWRPEPAREASEGSQSGVRPSVPQQSVSPQVVVPEQSRQQPVSRQVVPEQFQQQYIPQQYAPEQPSPRQPYEQQASAQIPQQFQQPAPLPMPRQIPQPYQPGTQTPYSAAEPEPQRPATVTNMVVPSAFTARNTGTFPVYGSVANPFAGLPGSPSAAPAEAAAEGEVTVLELATPGSRFLARIIDLGVAAVFSAPITISLLLVAHRHDHQYVLNLDAQATTTYTTLGMDALGIALWGGAAAALVLVAIVYEGYRLGRGGQTAGKRLAGIRVVRLSDAHPLRGGGTGIRRALIFWILAVLPLIDLVALGGVLWGRPYRQGLHERATATATVRV